MSEPGRRKKETRSYELNAGKNPRSGFVAGLTAEQLDAIASEEEGPFFS
jgi:hypothetical protein